MLAERKNIDVKVFYTWSQSEAGEKYDPGFSQKVLWDIPLLERYNYSFVNNVSPLPGSHHFKGIDNPTLISTITNWGADAVLIFGWAFKSHLAAIRFFYKKVPVFFRGDSTLLDEEKGFKQLLRQLVLRYVYSFIDKAFYAGIANEAYFKAMGLKENQLVLMPHAVDNGRFAANVENTTAASTLRQALNISADALVFLFAGKLEQKKQPDLLIKGFLALDSDNTFLIIAGSGELEKSLREKYSTYARIKFIGFKNQQEMPAVYNCCDVFVLPSKGPNETWGLAINEAMAAGKAVIASNKCGAAFDLIDSNKNGFVFNYDNLAELSKALNFFVNNRKGAIKMGNAGLEIIEQYSFKQDCIALECIVNGIELKED